MRSNAWYFFFISSVASTTIQQRLIKRSRKHCCRKMMEIWWVKKENTMRNAYRHIILWLFAVAWALRVDISTFQHWHCETCCLIKSATAPSLIFIGIKEIARKCHLNWIKIFCLFFIYILKFLFILEALKDVKRSMLLRTCFFTFSISLSISSLFSTFVESNFKTAYLVLA